MNTAMTVFGYLNLVGGEIPFLFFEIGLFGKPPGLLF